MSSVCRNCTLTLRNPVPMGVVIGALSVTSLARAASIVSWGIGVPVVAIMSTPASQIRQLILPAPAVVASAASTHRWAARASSGPTPSPRIKVPVYVLDIDNLQSVVGGLWSVGNFYCPLTTVH